MHSKIFLPFLSVLLLSCNTQGSHYADSSKTKQQAGTTSGNAAIKNVGSIPLPPGYKRMEAHVASFAAWLRDIALKKDNTVYLFNGSKKQNQSAQYAVLDISVGNKDLQQCADAIMRLRAEYLFSTKNYAGIVFTDNNNKPYLFQPPYNKQQLHQYLLKVFAMCGSASLEKQLHTKKMDSIEPGDVLIRGGFPGHAEMVMDVAINNEGEKIFLLAQSYMPAQDIHVLVNPGEESISPWYKITPTIYTPEYVFTQNELKTW